MFRVGRDVNGRQSNNIFATKIYLCRQIGFWMVHEKGILHSDRCELIFWLKAESVSVFLPLQLSIVGLRLKRNLRKQNVTIEKTYDRSVYETYDHVICIGEF